MESPDVIRAIYEHGVFRPINPVSLPESTEVTILPPSGLTPVLGCNSDELYAILSERYNSGDREGAARHNEHQP